MKIPRDLSGKDIVKALAILGYVVVRQKGSHIMVSTKQSGEHHLAIPNHDPVKIGTFNGILGQVANHFGLTKQEVLEKIMV